MISYKWKFSAYSISEQTFFLFLTCCDRVTGQKSYDFSGRKADISHASQNLRDSVKGFWNE